MPSSAEGTASQWLVSVRASGEVLTADVTVEKTRLLVTTTVPGRTRREIEGRLYDILEEAGEATVHDVGSRPIPGFLHHSIRGVLAWRSELLRTFPECDLSALLFHQSDRDVAFGFVGGATPVVNVDGVTWPGPWVPLSGAEAPPPKPVAKRARSRQQIVSFDPAPPLSQAFSMYAGRRFRLDLRWSADLRSPGGECVVSADIEWVGVGIDPRALDHVGPSLLEANRLDPALREIEGGEVSAPDEEAAVAESRAAEATIESAAGHWAARSVAPRVPDAVADATRANPFFQWLDTIATKGPVLSAESPSLESAPASPPPTLESAPASPPRSQPAGSFEPPSPVDGIAEETTSRFENVDEAVTPQAANEPGESFVEESFVAVEEPAAILAPSADWVPPASDASEDPLDSPELMIGADAGDFETQDDVALAGARTELRRPRRLGLGTAAFETSLARAARLAVGRVRRGPVRRGMVPRSTAERARSRGRSESAAVRVLRVVGLGGKWFELDVTSDPAGAWIAVDGKDVGLKTPAKIELIPGAHAVTLSIPDRGHATYPVRGTHRQKLSLAGVLSGTLVITSASNAIPIAISVDGVPHGYAPVRLERLPPGAHEVAFSGPGMDPWAQTVDIDPNRTSEIVARPFESPSTGVVEVRARFTDEEGQEVVKGAAVWIDGQRAGGTPLTLELPRGPHSIRVVHRSEVAPVQVIDLPGGNQRFADFDFGTGAFHPILRLDSQGTRDGTQPVSATLESASHAEVREMWLHVRSPERTWRRYPMTLRFEPSGVVGTVALPAATPDDPAKPPFYVSALTAVGDEYYTEILNAEKLPVKKSARAAE